MKGWILRSSTGANCDARALMVACGRWWAVEGLRSPVNGSRENGAGAWLGIKAHFRGIARRDAVEMYYFRGGYCGLAPIEDGLYNACCLVHSSLVREARVTGAPDFAAWLEAVAKHTALNARLGGAVQVGKTLATAPLNPARRRADGLGALVVGDASGFLDPFTGDGIAMALYSGRLAARKVARALAAPTGDRGIEHYDGRYRRELTRAVGRSYGVAGVLRRLVMARGGVQMAAAAMLPWLGPRLFNGTRWRHSEA